MFAAIPPAIGLEADVTLRNDDEGGRTPDRPVRPEGGAGAQRGRVGEDYRAAEARNGGSREEEYRDADTRGDVRTDDQREERPSRRAPEPVASSPVDRQHDKYGGMNIGAGFFGWLTAVGIAVILLSIVAAAGAVIGLTQAQATAGVSDPNSASTIGIAGGIALLVVLFLAYYAGGYVAGRMSRFDGARQGLAVWLVGLVITIALAIAGTIAGNEYNVLSQLNLPSIPVDGQTLTTGGIIAGVAALVVTLVAAILGGLTGTRYHKKVDRLGAQY